MTECAWEVMEGINADGDRIVKTFCRRDGYDWSLGFKKSEDERANRVYLSHLNDAMYDLMSLPLEERQKHLPDQSKLELR